MGLTQAGLLQSLSAKLLNMIPKKDYSVVVRSPSRGLVTRLPPEEADTFRQMDMKRVATAASNVRYEDGKIRNAPGLKKVTLNTPLLESIVSHWRFDEAIGAVPGLYKDANGAHDLTPSPGGLDANNYNPNFNGNQVPGVIKQGAFFKATFSNVQAAVSSASALLNLGAGAFTISGWFKKGATNTFLVGVTTVSTTDFSLRLIGSDLKLFGLNGGSSITATSAISDSDWHFVTVTFSAGTAEIFVDGVSAVSGAVTMTGSGFSTFSINTSGTEGYYDSWSVWTRVLTPDEITFVYNGGDGLDFPFFTAPFSLLFQGEVIDASIPKPLVGASGAKLWSFDRSYDGTTDTFSADLVELFDGTISDSAYPWTAQNFFNRIVFAQHDNKVQFWSPSWSPDLGAPTRNLPGLTTDDEKWDGVEAFFSHLILWKGDRIKWSDINDLSNWIPISQTASSFIATTNASFVNPAPGATVEVPIVEDPTLDFIPVVGQFVRLDDVQGGQTYYNFYQVTAASHTSVITGGPNSLTLKLLNLTGYSGTEGSSTTIATTQTIESLDANEAGELRNVGSEVNGPIFKIVAQGDYAYIFKERSIQTMQYTGLGNGTFFIHREISKEGAIARSAILNRGDGHIIFVGHREIYDYQGGPTPIPVLRQVSRQFYDELDRTRLQKIFMKHVELKNEIWINYPTKGGGEKVLVWNYFEDSASLDQYDTERLNGITAFGTVDWSTDPSWDSFAASVTWESSTLGDEATWESFVLASDDKIELIATGSGDIFVWGKVFSRDGEAYVCFSETQAFDFDNQNIWKYVDVVVINLFVRAVDSTPRRLYIQVGQQDNLDQDVRWTNEQSIEVQGNTPAKPIRVNPGGAGRWLRLRFLSRDVDVEWAVSGFQIFARPGDSF